MIGAMATGNSQPSRWEDHTARYLVVEDYGPAYCRIKGEEYDEKAWVSALLQMCSRNQLLVAISAGTRAAGAGKATTDDWETYVLEHVDTDLAGLLRDVLRRSDGGPPRVLIARQPLLLALKMVLENPSPGVGTSDPFVVATLLSHYAARHSYAGRRQSEASRKIAGFSEQLAMEIVANHLFNMPLDFGDLLARTRLLWTAYEERLVRYKARRPLGELLVEATGLGLDDLLVLAFGVFAHADSGKAGDAQPLDLTSTGLPQDSIDRFLARFSATTEELSRILVDQHGDWELLPIEDTPLLRVGVGQVVVLDIRLFQRRFTSALYWLVHDHERSIGDAERRRWTQAYSELVEIYAEDILKGFAGQKHIFFTEEQLMPLGGSAVDCGIDFGDFLLLADVVQHQMTVPTRMLCNADAFERDMKATVLKKVKQLDGSASALLGQTARPDHPIGRRPHRILPIVVQGADFPVNPVTVKYAREKALEEGLLRQPECAPVMVCTLDELEMIAALERSGLATAQEVLGEYAATGAEHALRNFVIARYGGTNLARSPRMQQALDQVFDLVQEAYAHLDAAAAPRPREDQSRR
jgi:hypothetical protein